MGYAPSNNDHFLFNLYSWEIDPRWTFSFHSYAILEKEWQLALILNCVDSFSLKTYSTVGVAFSRFCGMHFRHFSCTVLSQACKWTRLNEKQHGLLCMLARLINHIHAYLAFLLCVRLLSFHMAYCLWKCTTEGLLH